MSENIEVRREGETHKASIGSKKSFLQWTNQERRLLWRPFGRYYESMPLQIGSRRVSEHSPGNILLSQYGRGIMTSRRSDDETLNKTDETYQKGMQ